MALQDSAAPSESWRRARVGTAALRLVAGLMITAPALPLVATGASIMLYVSPTAAALSAAATRPAESTPTRPPPGRAVLARGLLAGAIGWLALGIVAAFLSPVDRANRGVYRALRTRVESLDIESRSLAQGAPGSEAPELASAANLRAAENIGAAEEVRRHVSDLKRELGDFRS